MLAVPRALLALVTLLLLAGCRSEPPGAADRAAPDSMAEPAAEPRVVVIRAGPLRLEPDDAALAIMEVSAGALLAVAPDEAAAGTAGWVRVATWDDRRGWIPVSDVVEAGLWAHYGAALGGVSPILLRPAYPVEGARWGIEAPFHSPGFTTASSAWLLSDTASAVRIARIDSIEDVCSERRHRFATTGRVATADRWPLLEGGLIAAPSGGRPAARALGVGPLEPEPGLAELGRRVAAGLAPDGAGAPEAVAWAALGTDAAWATFSWASEDVETGRSQLAAAAVFGRGPGGWEAGGTIPSTGSSAEIPTPGWRPVAAYRTGGPGRPTILLLEALEYEGARLEIWIERGGRYVRLYEGYYWGC